MSDQQSPDDPAHTPTSANPYVIEHYGFARPEHEDDFDRVSAPSNATPSSQAGAVGRPVRRPRRMVLAAGTLGLLLVTGVSGVAAATADTGSDGRGHRDRGVSLADRDGARPWGFDRPGGRP